MWSALEGGGGGWKVHFWGASSSAPDHPRPNLTLWEVIEIVCCLGGMEDLGCREVWKSGVGIWWEKEKNNGFFPSVD